MQRKPVVAIIGSGQAAGSVAANARALGRLMAQRGWVLITGGRDAGVMKAANQGAKQAGGVTVGILPDRECAVSPDVDIVIVTDTGEARNNIIVLSADVVIACGAGDPGTASEIALALKAGKKVCLLDADASSAEYLRMLGPELIEFVSTPEEAIAIAERSIRLSPDQKAGSS